MAEDELKVGQLVQIVGKNLKGRIAYVGLTNFSAGKWIGVVLDEERGKNNGSIKGVSYFKCAPNYGLFVRPAQLQVMEMELEIATVATEPTITAKPAESAVQPATRSHNPLQTTKMNQPKQAKQFFSSSSHLSLHEAATAASTSPSATSTSLPIGLTKRSKTSVSPSESFCCAKRSSFVETGFLEILHPKFTPGHPLRSPSFNTCTATSRSSLLICNEQQESRIKELEVKLLELNGELDVLKQQKSADKRKLRELEKYRVQHDQLLEFKTKIMEQHSQLQRELQRCRQELRDAHDTNGKYKRELDEVSESIELLTLDKEMAEERVETLQMELEMAQERNEELTLDVEILRAENESTVTATTPNNGNNASKADNVITVGEFKKLEQYNQRLRTTVVRLRDALTQEKQQQQKSAKELETKHSEISELKKTKETLSSRVEILESHVMDLKEQVDTSLGAETMVATLADIKLELEDRVKLLEEEVAELEALEEIHEQLIESNQELEIDLREEIDVLNATIKTLQHDKDEAYETLYDRDVTIIKFREQVKSLREQLEFPITSTSEELSTVSTNQDEPLSVDYNQVFSVTKAYERAIDVQLKTVELRISKMHVEYLLAFMHEDFMLRGGEHDVILIMLALQRVSEKVHIICNSIHEKFPASCEFGKDAIFEGFNVDRFAFRAKSLYFLYSIKLVLQQLVYALNHCEYEVCNHAAIYRAEVESQEKHIDEWVDMLKGGRLDEHSPIDSIARTLDFLNTLYANVILAQDLAELVDEHQLHGALLKCYNVGLDCLHTNAGLLQLIIQLGDEHTESFCLMQQIMERVSGYKQRMKKLQRKLPHSASDLAYNGLPRERMQAIQLTNDHFARAINVLAATAREATKDIASTTSDDRTDVAITHTKLWKIISAQCVKLGTEELQLPTAFFQRTLSLLDKQISDFGDFVADNENARRSNVNTLFVRSNTSTLLQRAQQLKQQSEDIKCVRQTLAEREKEIKTLKYVAKMKQNDFSEMQIRKDMAERNLTKILTEQDVAIAHIAEAVEHVDNEVSSKVVSVYQTVSALESQLHCLQHNFNRLQLSMRTKSQNVHTSSDESLREIRMLTHCLRQERAEHTRRQAEQLKHRVRAFEPIFVPQRGATQQRRGLATLEKQLQTLKKEWILSHIAIKPERKHITRRTNEFAKDVLETYFVTNPHRAAPSEFGRFSTPELRQILDA